MLSEDAFGVVVYPILVVLLIIAAQRSRANRPRLLCIGLFSIYAIEALKLTLFPIPVDGLMAQDLGAVPFWQFANFVPFRDFFSEGVDHSQIYRNVLVGVPIGYGAWFVLRHPSAFRIAGVGLGASLFVELSQAIIGGLIGFMYRVVDINDVILNVAGTGFGIVAFAAFGVVFGITDRRIGSPDGKYWSYVRSVTNRWSMARRQALSDRL